MFLLLMLALPASADKPDLYFVPIGYQGLVTANAPGGPRLELGVFAPLKRWNTLTFGLAAGLAYTAAVQFNLNSGPDSGGLDSFNKLPNELEWWLCPRIRFDRPRAAPWVEAGLAGELILSASEPVGALLIRIGVGVDFPLNPVFAFFLAAHVSFGPAWYPPDLVSGPPTCGTCTEIQSTFDVAAGMRFHL